MKIDDLSRAILHCVDQVETSEYRIQRFTGTAFSSDYDCYLVETFEPLTDTGKTEFPETFVAKVTWKNEEDVLHNLKLKGISVPMTYGSEKLDEKGNKRLLFEQYISGEELYYAKESGYWIETGKLMAKIHSAFWGAGMIPFRSAITFQKINDAKRISVFDPYYQLGYENALQRLKNCPFTLIHGDMFPTNVIISDDILYFIDLHDAGRGPYSMDIGRLTGSLSTDSDSFFCPCRDEVYKSYYDEIKPLLKREYKDYLQDIYAAQFMEGAANLVLFLGAGRLETSEQQYIDRMIPEMRRLTKALAGV